jgi:hypothetical protein
MNGTSCGGQLATIAALANLGTGNMGSVQIDGWNVPTTNTCNNYSSDINILLDTNFSNFTLDHVKALNPAISWPILSQIAGAGGNVSLHNWDITTATSTLAEMVDLTGGSVAHLAASGISWNDSLGTGSVFAGSQVPSTLTCSSYSGPNLLLAGGFAPATENGDCFTNTYPSTTTYVNTTFSEHTSGNLAGTTPATCTNGCTGPWTLASGTDFTYQSSPSISISATQAAPDLIIPGVTNYTLRATTSACGTVCAFVVRYTDANDFTVLNTGPTTGGIALYNVVGGQLLF